MPETPLSESIKDLVGTVDQQRLVLPEFQRNFVWEAEKTYDLFDSLARDIFIGPLIYGVPSFEITSREIDGRPRDGKGSRKKLRTTTYTQAQIDTLRQTPPGFRLILDGQQRITALYRAVKGVDKVWFAAIEDVELAQPKTLESALDEFIGNERADRLSISLEDVWKMVLGDIRRESAKRDLFEESLFATRAKAAGRDLDRLFEMYLGISDQLQDLLKAEKLLSYYLLDTSVDKFAMFFERSNSKGVRLTFIDILAAKLYAGFNLREQAEAFEEENPQILLNREHVVRMIAYLVSGGAEVKKSYILANLIADHFKQHWQKVTSLYVGVISYLLENNWIISQATMPYDNMVIPMMVFLDALPSQAFSQATVEQLNFLEYWYWASLFSERYSARTNETIIEDAKTLGEIAKGRRELPDGYNRRFISQVQSAEAVSDIQSPTSALFRSVLSLVNRRVGGLRDWKTGVVIPPRTEGWDSHHIFPRRYLTDPSDIDFVDSVSNRAYIPKITNIKIGKKAPSVYLAELAVGGKDGIRNSLESHLIDPELAGGLYDDFFLDFVKDRAIRLFSAINAVTLDVAEQSISPFIKPAEPAGS